MKSYPFPERNINFMDNQIYFIKTNNSFYINFCFEKNTSVDAITIANKFFSLENILIDSFQFVLPIKNNSQTCSVKFATIIRESCNLFELISRKLYHKFFLIESTEKLNIFHFLSLDVFLNLSKEELRAPTLDSYLHNNEKIEPFDSLKKWNRSEQLKEDLIPQWWTAYNKLKHDVESLSQYATLENSIYSLAAVFLLIRKVFGDGLISGFLRKIDDPSHTKLYQIKTSDLFIGETLRTENQNKRH